MKIYLFSLALIVLGGLFLGNSITGYVISQSCCSGEDCAPENLCGFAMPPEELKPHWIDVLFGLSLIFGGVSLFLYKEIRRKKLYK
ncbi:hypothetical protein D6774_02930 [Candidatus Woesearchaeota archaeon]|nr:MAG: hypothetical protein D6774_02930 [Candidatus Woesearchaeota archaeon]